MEQAFLQAILEKPTAEDSWLVLADWLEENGNGLRAELLRLQIALRHEGRVRARTEREKRVQQLLAEGVRPVVPTFTNSIGVQMALVPPGVFFMGSVRRHGTDPRTRPNDDEMPRRLVRITRPFFLSVTALTQEQYVAVMGENPSYFGPTGEGAQRVGGLDWRTLPVENVSYLQIGDFCHRLSARPVERKAKRVYRLPTEAEWEYACRGCICHVRYAFGHDLTLRQACFNPGNQPHDGTTASQNEQPVPETQHPVTVGSYRPNLFGLSDMHGNVWEWCSDWYDDSYYARGPRDNPPGPEEPGPAGERRVLRGGGWTSLAGLCRSALRGHNTPDARHNYNGFRLALSVPEEGRSTRKRRSL
jgi:uncharacterized protein (TIGR02996 family)